MIDSRYILLILLTLYSGNAETKTGSLFSKSEKNGLEYLKSKEFLTENFYRYIKQQSRKRLDIFATHASKGDKDLLIKEVQSGFWKVINIKDENVRG